MDGTLTAPRKVVTPEMRQFMADLRKKVTVGVVGGSDLVKAKEQLGEDYLDIVDWCVCLLHAAVVRARGVGRRHAWEHVGAADLKACSGPHACAHSRARTHTCCAPCCGWGLLQGVSGERAERVQGWQEHCRPEFQGMRVHMCSFGRSHWGGSLPCRTHCGAHAWHEHF